MHLDGATLTVDQLAEAAYQNTVVEVFPEQAARVKASRDLLEGFVKSGRIIYGVTTAVGGFVNWLIPEHLAEKLQNNILRGVATNVGADLDDVYVRAAMLCRINSLGRGVSAISPENFEKYIGVYNAGIVPCVPEQGSLGASGDLGPLAHIALVVTGAWRARYQGEVLPGEEALKTSLHVFENSLTLTLFHIVIFGRTPCRPGYRYGTHWMDTFWKWSNWKSH